MSATPAVAPGQMWADCDLRSAGRTLLVLSVEDGKATCRIETNCHDTQRAIDDGVPFGGVDRRGATTRIAVIRFRPTTTGYRLLGPETPLTPRSLLVNGERTHLDSGRRSSFNGARAAITACGRYLTTYTETDPTTDAPSCGQCTRRKEP